MLIITYYVTKSLVVILWLYLICYIKLQWVCILRNRVFWRQPKYDFDFFSGNTFLDQIIDLSNILWYIGVTIFQKSHMSGDKNVLFTVPSKHMPIYISITMHYTLIDSSRILSLRLLTSTMYLGETMQLISYQSIGATVRFGFFIIHRYYVWGVPWAW